MFLRVSLPALASVQCIQMTSCEVSGSEGHCQRMAGGSLHTRVEGECTCLRAIGWDLPSIALFRLPPLDRAGTISALLSTPASAACHLAPHYFFPSFRKSAAGETLYTTPHQSLPMNYLFPVCVPSRCEDFALSWCRVHGSVILPSLRLEQP